MIRTSEKPFYGVMIGRLVIFLARPELTRQKKYREPIVVKKKKFRDKKSAEIAVKQWEGL
jgi:hypothetical protein